MTPFGPAVRKGGRQIGRAQQRPELATQAAATRVVNCALTTETIKRLTELLDQGRQSQPHHHVRFPGTRRGGRRQ
jgi:hypothetical protein